MIHIRLRHLSSAAVIALLAFMMAPRAMSFGGDDEPPLHTIHHAAWAGQLTLVKQFCKKQPSLKDKILSDFGTPLYIAAGGRRTSIVTYLLQLGANPNKSDRDGVTPLHAAANMSALSCVQALIAAGADVNAKNKSGVTPLCTIYDAGYAGSDTAKCAILELLIAKGANVDTPDNGGATPLYKAAYYGSPNMAAVLLKHKADAMAINKEGRTIRQVIEERIGRHEKDAEEWKKVLDQIEHQVYG